MEVFTLSTFISGLVATILPSIIAAVVAYRINKKSDKRYEESKRIREEQIKSEKISMEMQAATASLSYACAIALKRGKANGEVEEAVKEYNDAKKKYQDYINAAYVEHKVDLH